MLAMTSFAVDYGYLLVVQTDLQRAADAAAIAAVQDLIPAADGTQDLAAVRARVREYAALNYPDVTSFQVLDADIQIGRYDPATIYSNITLLETGVLDTVQVTLRRDALANSPVALFFAPILGIKTSAVTATATAVLQKANILKPGTPILPFSVPLDVWNSKNPGETWSIYGDGKLTDSAGATIPGNWGTIDIGSTSNSTSDLVDQISNGLRQSDLDELADDGRIPSNTQIDGSQPMWAQADTGLSSGIKSAVKATHGETRLVPIYDALDGNLTGNNTEFHVVGWGVVEVVTSNWKGAHNTYVTIMKSYMYNSVLVPTSDLSVTTGLIEGAYTSPALIK